jgi:hypothetical protein
VQPTAALVLYDHSAAQEMRVPSEVARNQTSVCHDVDEGVSHPALGAKRCSPARIVQTPSHPFAAETALSAASRAHECSTFLA